MLDDGYYTAAEAQMYETPIASRRPSLDVEPEIRWQRGNLIGTGAFGKVYHGLNLHTGQMLAIKQIAISAQTDQKELDVFRQEVAVLKDL
jgi:serine/threonine protein kinase